MAMEKSSRSWSLVAAGLFAAVLMTAAAGIAFAQDANDQDVPEQSTAQVQNISGCWQGNAFNDSQGNTLITFFFAQQRNKLAKKHSTLDLESAVSVHGPIAGKVKTDHFTFHGHVAAAGAANGCNIKGKGFFQTDGSLSGSYSYVGTCFEHQFTGGEFSQVTFLGATCP